MPVKNKGSAIVVERMAPVRKPRAGDMTAPHALPDHRPDTKELLKQIEIRGERLSAEIKELLVRMS